MIIPVSFRNFLKNFKIKKDKSNSRNSGIIAYQYNNYYYNIDLDEIYDTFVSERLKKKNLKKDPSIILKEIIEKIKNKK